MPSVYSRTLRRAAHIVGGNENLAARLGVSSTDLVLWMQGIGVPPSDVFLEAADVVTAQGVSELLSSRKD
jgi:DNA-binding transcriptional regulator YdaS (Cro superfamily)